MSPGLEKRIVLKPSTQCGGVVADPSDPESSVLVEKVQPDPECGVAMPMGRDSLSELEVQCVVEWVSGLVAVGPDDGGTTTTTGEGGESEGSSSSTTGPAPEACVSGESRECYSGLPETLGQGACKAGMQTCGANLLWGPCEGEVPPVGENCMTPADENCDGKVPECSETWVIGYQQIDAQQARAVAVDRANDDVIVIGDFENTVVFGGGPLVSDNGKHDIFLGRYDRFGNPLWTRKFGDSSNQYASDVLVDATGHIVVLGRAFGIIDFGGMPHDALGTDDVFVARFDSSGNYVWSQMVGGIDPDRSERAAVDAEGNVYVTGTFTGDGTFGDDQYASHGLRDLFIMKLAVADGQIEWTDRIGGAGDDYGWGVAADASGVYFTGYFSETVDFGGKGLKAVNDFDVIIGKYDPAGKPLWANAAGGMGVDRGYDMGLLSGGDFVVMGAFTSTLDFGGMTDPLTSAGGRDIFLARFKPDGTGVWAHGYGDSRDQFENDYEVNTYPGMAIGVDDTIHLAGSLAGAANFGGEKDTISAGKTDVFLARLDADGGYISAKRWGGGGTEMALAVDADSMGNALLAGRFFSMTFNLTPAGSLTGMGNSDGFVVKLPAP